MKLKLSNRKDNEENFQIEIRNTTEDEACIIRIGCSIL